MTNHWIDIKNADAVLIMGSNAAEHHPISFKWVLQAKDKGAVVIHVDPKFSRTSARSSFHVPLRSGTDIAFLGGMIKYILDNDLIQKEYVPTTPTPLFSFPRISASRTACSPASTRLDASTTRSPGTSRWTRTACPSGT